MGRRQSSPKMVLAELAVKLVTLIRWSLDCCLPGLAGFIPLTVMQSVVA